MATENDSVCTNCRSRNISCVLQDTNVNRLNADISGPSVLQPEEFWKGASTSQSSSQGQAIQRKPASDLALNERLSQVENVLSQITSREGTAVSPTTTRSPSNSSKTPLADAAKPLARTPVTTAILAERSAPVFSLFQNTFGGPIASAEDGPDKPVTGLPEKLEQLRLELGALLPSQQDTDMLAICTDAWASAQVFGNLDEGLSWQENLAQSLNLDVIARSHPVVIAKALLYVILWIQQLPKQFDPSQLPLRGPPEPYMRDCISKISAMISEDELVCTKDGLEDLVLLGTLHANAGNIRKAWLIFRRALAITQLLGFPPPKGLRRSSSDTLDAIGKSPPYGLWQTIVTNDCRLSLLLALAPGTNGDILTPEETEISGPVSPQAALDRYFCSISVSIGERNYSGGFSSIAPTQTIDEDIDKAQREIPESWWSIPTLYPEPRSQEVAAEYQRLVSQMWFFQLKVLVHVPFAFRAVRDRRYEYHQISCMSACEDVLRRYFALRKPEIAQVYCAVIDFLAFIASTTIILLTLQKLELDKGDMKKAQDTNIGVVREAFETMNTFATNNPKERMTRRGAEVLRTLLSVYADSETDSSTTHLDIPFFGKVSIIRPANAQQPTHSSNIPFVPDMPTSRTNRPIMAGIIPREPRYVEGTVPSRTTTLGHPTISFDTNVFMPNYPSANLDWSLRAGDNIFFDDGLSDMGAGPWMT